ncbi:MAG: vitamin K epoxide reductase family protein [Wenzhouxiangella sp.]|jgi:uncharacterized membrane protein|nr:vitamin K epoxide reductase family protein [Wenzhouxiangella sp.]
MAKRKKSQPAPKKAAVAKRRTFRPDWPITGLAIAGLAVTGYLSVARTLSTSPLLCGEGSSCDLVQQSHWSLLLGLPVSLWGFGLYLLIALIAGLGRPRLKRWQRLWMLSYFGVAFSVYLTLAGWLALEAFCLWCTISLGLIAAIFVVLNLRRPESAPGMSWGGFLGGQTTTVAVALLALHAVYAGWFQPSEDPRLRALAEHLQGAGAVYYGAFWCPSCQQQSRLFGASADRLPYVECSPQGRNGGVAFECVSNDITAYPTWVIRGRKFEEMLEPEELARRTQFDWDGWQAESSATPSN